jgi:hypothetical protein
MPYSAMGLSHGITDLDALEPKITKVLDGYRSESGRSTSYNIHNAAENVQKEILKLI